MAELNPGEVNRRSFVAMAAACAGACVMCDGLLDVALAAEPEQSSGTKVDVGTAADYPKDNFFPASVDAVGFVDSGRHRYALSPKSRYRGAATDGTDPGVNMEALRAAMGRDLLP